MTSEDTTVDPPKFSGLNYTFEEVRVEAERVYGSGCEITFEKNQMVVFLVRGRLGGISVTHQNVNYVLCAAYSALSTLPSEGNT